MAEICSYLMGLSGRQNLGPTSIYKYIKRRHDKLSLAMRKAEKKMVMETSTGSALLGIFQAKGPNRLFPVAEKSSCLTYVCPTICTQMRGRERGRRRSEGGRRREGEGWEEREGEGEWIERRMSQRRGKQRGRRREKRRGRYRYRRYRRCDCVDPSFGPSFWDCEHLSVLGMIFSV